jgi:hypothetical protein
VNVGGGAGAAAAAGEARHLWAAGVALSVTSDRQAQTIARDFRVQAAELLDRSLRKAPADADYRGEATFHLGRARLFLAVNGMGELSDATRTLAEAVPLLRRDGRADDAGLAASLALAELLRAGRAEEARAFADAVKASSGDFGVSGDHVRMLAAGAATGVGAKLPALPASADVSGKPIDWAALRGNVLVLHFFHAGRPTGKASEQRDVETVLRPLYDELKEKPVRFVGVSMDLALTREQVEKIRANWDEWGVKGAVQDGSPELVGRYADSQGIAWPWTCTGKWMNDPVSLALGGCGRSQPHAIVVGRDGTILWRGDAPFTGLPEAVRAALR